MARTKANGAGIEIEYETLWRSEAPAETVVLINEAGLADDALAGGAVRNVSGRTPWGLRGGAGSTIGTSAKSTWLPEASGPTPCSTWRRTRSR